MKKLVLIATVLIAMTMLTACGNKDNNTARNEASPQMASNGPQAGTAVVEAPLLTGGEVAAQIGAQGDLKDAMAATDVPAELTSVSADGARPVDLDLTKISGTVVYSQVYDMMMNPDGYMGQKVKMKGSFNYFQDPETKQEYFAAIIADATACCAQGIEFVWKGDHVYPQEYPPLETEITVTGTFSTYYEGENMYVQLVDADVEWEKA